MEKVISVMVSSALLDQKKSPLVELELTELNKALEEGFIIKSFHQTSPSQSSAIVVLTFILHS